MKYKMPLWAPAALGAALGYRMASGPYKTKTLRGTRARLRVRGRANYRMASMKRRRTKNWKAAARRQVGLPRGFSTSKTTETIFPVNVTVPKKSIWLANPIRIAKGALLNQRLRDTVVVSGIKLNIHVMNRQITAGNLVCNWAMVVPRANKSLTAPPGFGNITNFFRDYGEERAWDTNSINKTGVSWADAKINLDDFVVLTRGKFELSSVSSTGNPLLEAYNRGNPEKHVSRWIKLGRSITFDGDAIDPDEQIRFVFWCTNRNDNTQLGGEGCDLRVRAICYFREPKTG